MSVLILLLIASLSVSLLFLGAFIWSTKNKQFDDEYSSSVRILFEDQPLHKENKEEEKTPVIHINTHKRSENTSHQLN
jgi:cbb3-type cytochrome oxidase maturation protein